MSSGPACGSALSGGGRGFTLSVAPLAPPTSPQTVLPLTLHQPFEGASVPAGPG